MKARQLDKFYTNADVARDCLALFEQYAPRKALMIEPSAGAGAFLQSPRMLGFDIAPERSDIFQCDFLNDDLGDYISTDNLAFVGNPPFGRRGALAIAFINRALEYSQWVGFIVPRSLRKYSAHKRINKDARLIVDIDIPNNSFTIDGRPYKRTRCCFQIWTTGESDHDDMRIRKKPPVSHPDFEILLHNCAEQSARHLDADWDFAVHRQGEWNYNARYCRGSILAPNRQWMMFKANDNAVLSRLLMLDFAALAKTNACIDGFGKTEVVAAYMALAA